jgi:hypothetical protein
MLDKKKGDDVVTMVEETTQEVGFICTRYPYLKVLVERIPGGINVTDKVVKFQGGYYKTSDPKEIEILSKRPAIRKDDGTRHKCNLCNYTTADSQRFADHVVNDHKLG